MKHVIFKLLISFWQIWPAKKMLSKLIKKSNYLTTKLYKDLRYKGTFDVNFDQYTIKLYNPGFTTIENEIYWYGIDQGWEKVSLQIWRYFAANSNVILDVGANSGVYSLIAAAVNNQAEIHSFEPVSRTLELLNKNIALNQFHKIEIHSKAVSDNNGKAIFYDVKSQSQYSASLNKEMLQNISDRIEYMVDVIQLDTFIPLTDKKIDLIKIDVEMHEYEVLLGMKKILEFSRPILLIEILTDEIGQRIEKFFQGKNYLYYNIDEIGIPEEKSHLLKSNHYNFLLLPFEKEEDYKKVNLKHVIQ